MSISGAMFGTPGNTAELLTSESAVLALPFDGTTLDATIVSTTTDSGSDPTTLIRAGTVMGKIAATNLWTKYSPTAVDGSQIAKAILTLQGGLSMLDPYGTAANKTVGLLFKGTVIAANCPNLDAMARQQLRGKIVFDDDAGSAVQPFLANQIRATDLTITAALYPAGTRFSTYAASGTVTFTLPALAPGLWYEFYNAVDQTMAITAPAANSLIGLNSLTSTTMTFSTGGQKISAGVRVVANAAATKWETTLISGGVCAATLS